MMDHDINFMDNEKNYCTNIGIIAQIVYGWCPVKRDLKPCVMSRTNTPINRNIFSELLSLHSNETEKLIRQHLCAG